MWTSWMFVCAPLRSIITFYFREQGPGSHPAWSHGERGGEREPEAGGIGTTAETLPNRMWLWFLTSFHSQLSDRFLLRWHLLHNDAQKCGTVRKWGSCCPTCQAVSVTSSPPPLSCDSTTLTTVTTTKLKAAAMQMMHCTCLTPTLLPPFTPPLLFPTSAS